MKYINSNILRKLETRIAKSAEIVSVRLVVENYFHFHRKRFQNIELSFHFKFSIKILENAFG